MFFYVRSFKCQYLHLNDHFLQAVCISIIVLLDHFIQLDKNWDFAGNFLPYTEYTSSFVFISHYQINTPLETFLIEKSWDFFLNTYGIVFEISSTVLQYRGRHLLFFLLYNRNSIFWNLLAHIWRIQYSFVSDSQLQEYLQE